MESLLAGKKKKSSTNDPIPKVGAATDGAPMGRGKTKPPHERTADEEVDVVDWEKVAAMAEFKALLAAKRKFILPTTVFFVVYYFALPILVGYAPEFMKTRVIGSVNLAYLFALSQFLMAWIVAALYMRAAGRFDGMIGMILAQLKKRRR